MNNVHLLRPCGACDVRMAVPGLVICTTCNATLDLVIEAVIPKLIQSDGAS